ncbi:MAG: hypothetical protein UY21_C0001G0104 [Microgenomates group bacterium GW2011_GWA1_48_10]|nr:MAG: hypothetical protein UY21_C0001G0104 [Microgenomates group bacterium GW2011_GWA1_48_10]
MYEEINERVTVVAVFKNGHALPYLFNWRGRKYRVEEVNLEHEERRGDELLFCYSISAGGNAYELSFNNRHLVWTLERVWQ